MGTKTWDGGATGDWNVSSNWSPAGVPVTGDDVVINTAGCTVTLDEHIGGGQTNTGLGSLTITAGTLQTNDGSNRMLKVTGVTSITGILNCTGSDIFLGDNVDDAYSVVVNGSGTFTGGTGTHKLGAISVNSGATNFTFSSGNTTITGRATSGNSRRVFSTSATDRITAAGTLFIDQARTPLSIRCDDTTGINNLTMNCGTGRVLHIDDDLTLVNTLTVSAGTVTTRNVGDTVDNNLTVGGHIFGNGTFIANGSTVTVAGQCAPANVELTAGSITSTDDFRPTTKTTIDGNGAIVTSAQLGGLFDIGGSNTPTLTGGRIHSSLDIPTGNQGQSIFNLNLSEDQASSGAARHLFFYKLVLNATSSAHTYTMLGAITATNAIIITQGELNTGSDHALTAILDETDIQAAGTLTGNASAISLMALTIRDGGTYNGTSGTTTISGEQGGYAWSNQETDGTGFVHNNGTVTITTPTTTVILERDSFYNLIINNGDNITQWDASLTCAGTLLVNAGDTFYADDAGNTLTVTGAVTVNGVLGTSGRTGAYSFGSLTIAVGGTYNATSGETSITGAGGISRAGTFTHNNGTVDFEAATTVIQSTTMTGSNAFYILKSTGQTWYRIDQDIDIERHASTGYVFWFYGNVTVTMGTDTYSSGTDNSNKCINWSYVYGTTGKTYKLYAKNELYPWQYDYAQVGNSSWINGSQDARMGTVHLKGGNIIGDFTMAQTTNPKSIILDGDMEFDGLTVGGTNTLDLNGQRVEFGGLLNNQGILTDGGDKSLVLASNIDTTGTTRNISGASDLILTGSGNIYWGATGGGWNTAFFNGGAFDTWAGQNVFGTCLIGSGDLDVLHDTEFNNIKVATGGELDGNSSTVTATGDFNSFGGLIGKSAADITGVPSSSAQYIQKSSFTDFSSATEGTIECWFNADDIAHDQAGLVNPFGDTRWNIYVNKSGSDLYLGYEWDNGGTEIYGGNAVLIGPSNSGKWHHCAMTIHETNGYNVYLDGKLVKSGLPLSNQADVASATLSIGATSYSSSFLARCFDGQIGRASVWTKALTETQIRKMLFYDWTALAADTGTFTDTDCCVWYQFDAGTGTAVEDYSTGGSENDGTMGGTASNATWVGGGTLSWTGGSTPSAGTLNMTGAGTTPTLTCKSATKFFNVTVGTSGEVTLAGHPYIYGLLTVDANGITDGAGAETIGIAGTSTPVVHASQDFSNISQIHYQTGGSAITITPTTYSICRLTASTAGTLVGAFVGTTLQVDGSCSLTAQNTTIQTRGFNINGANAVVNVVGTDITLTDASPYGFTGGNSTTTFSAGPGTTFTGHASKSRFTSTNNFSVVGKIENLDVTDEELKVTGQVINCTGDIHQYFPTIDHAQQLDADTADDRDVRLGRDLDKNTELINS